MTALKSTVIHTLSGRLGTIEQRPADCTAPQHFVTVHWNENPAHRLTHVPPDHLVTTQGGPVTQPEPERLPSPQGMSSLHLRATIRRLLDEPGHDEDEIRPSDYHMLAAYVTELLSALDNEKRGAPLPPRRMLCAICIQISEEGDYIHEAMTVVHGTMVCHEHHQIMLKEQSIGFAVLAARQKKDEMSA